MQSIFWAYSNILNPGLPGKKLNDINCTLDGEMRTVVRSRARANNVGGVRNKILRYGASPAGLPVGRHLQSLLQSLQKTLHFSLAAEIVICKVNPCKQSCK